jgi:N-acyl-D-aspartate/D-glutamate deacylase
MPQPGDPPSQPPNPARRKVLLAGGFAAANYVVLRNLGDDRLGGSGNRVRVDVVGDQVGTPPRLSADQPDPPPGHRFDTVISAGRVIDPASEYDAIADVGIDGDRITAISTDPLTGENTIDAAGLIVAPGFIDVLSYEPNAYGIWYKVGDGVTTNLGMHGINNTAAGFFEFFGSADQRPPVHFGGAFDNAYMRNYQAGIGSDAASASELALLEQQVEEGFADGWVGLSFEPEYTPWVTTEEITRLSAIAARHGFPVFSHIRSSSPDDPDGGSLAALDELLRVADETGAAVHVDHITSMNTHVMGEALERLEAARSRGVDVTACMYPYDFWATTLASERFAPGWQERFRIDYEDLEVPGTGERLTESTFRRYQEQNRLVAAHAIPEADVRAALEVPWIMIGSDAILEPEHNNHPRATGAFTRTLGRYVRETGLLSWSQALAKMTVLPAQRIEGRVPAMRRKGRLQIGADADVTVFDPDRVQDRSTVEDPAQMAAGVAYVLVMGTVVKEGEIVHDERRPGQPIRPGAG